MKTVKLSELFDIDKPSTLIYSNCIPDDNGINYVSSKGENNGIVGKVQLIPNRKIYEAGCITVPLKGTVLEAHVQPEKCYVAHQIAVLTPKKEMNIKEKIYYCMCIKANKFKYSYGRQADNTISDLLLPAEIPDWVYEIEEPNLSEYKESFTNNPTPELNIDSWKKFKLTDLFDIVKGNNTTQSGPEKTYPYISSSSTNNGVSDYRESDKYHPGGLLTVSANGACMDTFYQSEDFISCGDVNVLYPKSNNFNKYNAMFFIPILELEKFRFGYGRKSSLDRIKQLTIKLPATPEEKPDYQFMEDYIKTLPYSKYI